MSTTEQCRPCTEPEREFVLGEDIPLCNAHWNWWLIRFLDAADLPPCAAHVIVAPGVIR